MRAVAFAAAIGGSALAATEIVNIVEVRSEDSVREALSDIDFSEIVVATDGLQLLLDGEVSSESERFRVLSVAGELVDPDRLIDRIEIVRPDPPEVTKFSLEILRNRDGISLIGLVPADPGKDAILTALSDYGVRGDITDMMDAAAHSAPDNWPRALAFALNALRDLPRSKISVTDDEVFITALVDNDSQQSQISDALRNSSPEGVTVTLDIAAPRPVVSPFILRFSKSAERAGFDACTVDSDEALEKIAKSAKSAGTVGDVECQVALGVPTKRWGDAVSLAIASIESIGGGTVSLSDTDVTFVALEGTSTLR